MQTDGIQLRELTVRYSVKKTDVGDPVVVGRALKSPRESAALLMHVLADQPTEVFAMLCLSSKHRIIAYHEVSRGTIDSTLVHPREVFKAAVLECRSHHRQPQSSVRRPDPDARRSRRHEAARRSRRDPRDRCSRSHRCRRRPLFQLQGNRETVGVQPSAGVAPRPTRGRETT